MTATPFGSPVEPEVYITYANCCGSLRTSTAAEDTPANAASSSTVSTTAHAGTSPAAFARSTSSTRAPAASTIHCRRSGGYPLCNGTYTPPAFTIASVATTTSTVRSINTATGVSGPTPSSSSRRANRLERASNSAYVNARSSAPPQTAGASGAPATCTANNSCSEEPSCGTTTAVLFHSLSTRSRSAPPRISSSPIGRVGSATAAVRSSTSLRPISSTVSRSYRSAANSIAPLMPAAAPVSSVLRPNWKSRSNLAVPVPGATTAADRTPGSSTSGPPASCTAKATWKSGWRASERAGLTASTTCSKGRSWRAKAARSACRTRATSSLNEGSPETSDRSTRVLTKKPTSSAKASSVRPAVTVPRGMSVPAPSRDSSAARPACSTISIEACCPRASSCSAEWTGAGSSNSTNPPA